MNLWTDRHLADPHAVADKARRVQRMFAAIAPRYDLNNRLHSLGRDQAWRRRAVAMAGPVAGARVLDVACGTGDLALAFAAAGARQVLGCDFTFDMLTIARRKCDRCVGAAPRFHAGDAMRLPLADGAVDVASIAFGIRNVVEPSRAIAEFHRVLRPGGRLVILEFGLPTRRVTRALYGVYFRHVLPRTAAWIAGDRTGAYRYLPRSVHTFLDRPALLAMMTHAGFVQAECHGLTFGIAVLYRAIREG